MKAPPKNLTIARGFFPMGGDITKQDSIGVYSFCLLLAEASKLPNLVCAFQTDEDKLVTAIVLVPPLIWGTEKPLVFFFLVVLQKDDKQPNLVPNIEGVEDEREQQTDSSMRNQCEPDNLYLSIELFSKFIIKN